MGAVGFGVEGGFGFGGIVAALEAIKAVTEPRSPPIPAQGASELPSVAGSGLVGACHGYSTSIIAG
jgi:hypothetical protein